MGLETDHDEGWIIIGHCMGNFATLLVRVTLQIVNNYRFSEVPNAVWAQIVFICKQQPDIFDNAAQKLYASACRLNSSLHNLPFEVKWHKDFFHLMTLRKLPQAWTGGRYSGTKVDRIGKTGSLHATLIWSPHSGVGLMVRLGTLAAAGICSSKMWFHLTTLNDFGVGDWAIDVTKYTSAQLRKHKPLFARSNTCFPEKQTVVGRYNEESSTF